jgi:purine-nucleoside phosphorylase
MDKYEETAEYIRTQVSGDLHTPLVAIICGSGLGGLADTVRDEGKVELDYASIPHFPLSTGKRTVKMKGFYSFWKTLDGETSPWLIGEFPGSITVQGHAGKLILGLLGGNVPAVLMVGRTQFVNLQTTSHLGLEGRGRS